MKILIVGAGAIGGYFGGRLLEKGADVTFLVREKRQQQLRETGLVVESIHGYMHFPEVKTILADDGPVEFDVILLSTKSYHLNGAIADIRPFVGEATMILPLLNGMAHLDDLKKAFGEKNVLGGLCFIETTLDGDGRILQTSPVHDFVFGELNGEKSDRVLQLADALAGTKANFRLSDNIEQEMWHKYLFITSLSGITSLFRSPIGPIREEDSGAAILRNLVTEAGKIMRGIAAPLADGIEDVTLGRLIEIGYSMKSSLQRDMEKQLPTEGGHLFGYLLEKAAGLGFEAPTLATVDANQKIYETNRRSLG